MILRYVNSVRYRAGICGCILVALLLVWLPVSLVAGRTGGIRTVVIDAGHGGKDPGALGKHAQEKNINLAIALKLGKKIREEFPGVKVIFTRDDDHFVELYRRASVANEAKADLFISIHCNSNRNPGLRGAETYIMGLHKSVANLNTAKAENAAILLESGYQSTYEGFDPNSDESYIIFSLNQNANLDRSTELAAAIQAQMSNGVGLSNRGVRQAGFLVLYRTTMPSVLVEAGYLSHPEEEKFLLSEKGQEHIAEAIFKAFGEIAGTGETSAPVVKTDTPAAKAGEPQTHAGIPPVKKNTPPPEPVAGKENRAGKKTVLPEKPAGDHRLSFRVQIAAEAKPLKPDAPRIKGFGETAMYRHGGLYKYTVGDEPDLPSVLRLLDQVRAKGAKDAFVVIFRDGQRIPEAEAARLMKK